MSSGGPWGGARAEPPVCPYPPWLIAPLGSALLRSGHLSHCERWRRGRDWLAALGASPQTGARRPFAHIPPRSRCAPAAPLRGARHSGWRRNGGEGGIRTLGSLSTTHDFQSCTFDHSVTSPGRRDRGPAAVRVKQNSKVSAGQRKRRVSGACAQINFRNATCADFCGPYDWAVHGHINRTDHGFSKHRPDLQQQDRG